MLGALIYLPPVAGRTTGGIGLKCTWSEFPTHEQMQYLKKIGNEHEVDGDAWTTYRFLRTVLRSEAISFFRQSELPP